MKNLFALFAILFCSLSLFSQDNTRGETVKDLISRNDSSRQGVLIIPFEPKMYISDISDTRGVKDDLSPLEIKAKFRTSLDLHIYLNLKRQYNVLSFFRFIPEEAKEELSYIYNSLGYKYEVLPKEESTEKETLETRFLNKFKRKEKPTDKRENGIYGGQVVSNINNQEKYMQAKIENDSLLTSLNRKFQTKYYVFITELDINKSAEDVYKASEDKFIRQIKVHYTIFNNNSKIISSGAIKASFPSTQNDVKEIIQVHFPIIGQKIAAKLNDLNTTAEYQ